MHQFCSSRPKPVTTLLRDGSTNDPRPGSSAMFRGPSVGALLPQKGSEQCGPDTPVELSNPLLLPPPVRILLEQMFPNIIRGQSVSIYSSAVHEHGVPSRPRHTHAPELTPRSLSRTAYLLHVSASKIPFFPKPYRVKRSLQDQLVCDSTSST